MALSILLMACGSTKSLEAQQKTVPITVQTIPNGAKVYVDGKLVSMTTPATINVPTMASNIEGLKKKVQVLENNTINIQIVKDGYEIVKDAIVPKIDIAPGFWVFSWPENLIYELKERADTRVN
ncbi:MAG: PEGA domain-containing protein, partial [Prevotella sp.]|nr:PEGA domain-containing protein [Prevotella sp.]